MVYHLWRYRYPFFGLAVPSRSDTSTITLMRKTLATVATIVAIVALAGCSPSVDVSPDVEWLAATTGERDAEAVQVLLNDVHQALGVEPGPDVDKMSAEVLRERRDIAIVPHLECILAVAEREGGGSLAGLSDRCNEDWAIQFDN